MSTVMEGQADLFDLLEADETSPSIQPTLRVHLSSWRGKATCGWCGGAGLHGGGACRHPDNKDVSIGYDYCQKCADKNGYPRMYKGGTPVLLTADDGKRIVCPMCLSSWGATLKPVALAEQAREHSPAEPGRCALMVRLGVTEPFYSPRETPWASGFHVQYPRPEGFAGLYQLGARA